MPAELSLSSTEFQWATPAIGTCSRSISLPWISHDDGGEGEFQSRGPGCSSRAGSAPISPFSLWRLRGYSPSKPHRPMRARKWRMVSPASLQNFFIKIRARKSGYCFQWAAELLLRLDALKLKTLELHWAESDAGTDTEHNVIAVTARGQPFAEGIMLDNWRHSGHLLWGPLNGDPNHTWQENKGALARRVNRRASPADRPKRETNPKSKPQPQSKTPTRGERSEALRSLPSSWRASGGNELKAGACWNCARDSGAKFTSRPRS